MTQAPPEGFVLSPCPFCGNIEEIRVHENTTSPVMNKPPNVISCDITHWCACDSLPRLVIKVTGRDKEEAVTAWNKRTAPPSDALMNKAVDRMHSIAPDEISVISTLVGLRDFADRSDYCPKVMKAKLSECIDNLQKLYHGQPIAGLAEAITEIEGDRQLEQWTENHICTLLEAARRELARGG